MVYTREQKQEAYKRHYQKFKQKFIDRNNEKRRALNEYIRELKRRPCFDCGQSYPYYVMDFDHRPDTVKLYEPSKLNRFSSKRVIITELAKCDLVCSNCHRIRTFERASAKAVQEKRAEQPKSLKSRSSSVVEHPLRKQKSTLLTPPLFAAK